MNMPNLDTDRPDAPGNWDAYARMLRSTPAPTLGNDRAGVLLPRIGQAIERRARRARTIRFVMAPAAALCTILVVFAFVGFPWMQAEQSDVAAPVVTKVSTQNRVRAQHRTARPQLPAPSVSETRIPEPADAGVAPPRILPESVHVDRAEAIPSPGPGLPRLALGQEVPIP